VTRVPKQSETKARVFEPAEGPRPVSAAPAPDAGLRAAAEKAVAIWFTDTDLMVGMGDAMDALRAALSRQAEKETA
jgi:hypothetical protein